MSSGLKYRCEIIVPEDSPYRRVVQELTWKPFRPLPSKNSGGKVRRSNKWSKVNHRLLTKDGSVMVGYFTGSRAFDSFAKVFGKGIYLNYQEVFRKGFGFTRVYTIFEPERHLDETGHKMLLRASVYGGLSAKRKREIGGVMRAIDYGYMRVFDGCGNLVTVQREAVYMLNAWGYSVDESKRIICWPEGLTFTRDERKAELSKVAGRKDLPPKVKKEIQECLSEIREREREEYERAHPPINWRNLFRVAKTHYEGIGLDFRRSATALGLIRSQMGNRSTEKMESIVRARLQRRGTTTYVIEGREVDAQSLVRLACDDNQEALIALADLLAGFGMREPNTPPEQTVSTDDNRGEIYDIPPWALPEKAAIMQWKEAAKRLSSSSREGQIARYISSQIGKGQLNVLVFDGELYDEIVEADLVGGANPEIVSFPFHTALVRLSTFDGVLGVAVFRWQDFRESVNHITGYVDVEHTGYGMAYLTLDGGVDLNPDTDLRNTAEKLIIYLDCDNAYIDTVYVDGGVSRKRTNDSEQLPRGLETTYVRGADLVTGTQVVIERGASEGIKSEPSITRRAHFRRGYYARRRIGKKENWHYERRWIKPTFVHGSIAIVTERRVRRLVL